MNGFCDRFAPLMAETLHLAGTPQGVGMPLDVVSTRLTELVEQERASSPASAPAAERQELNQARFAVAAWADEQISSSSRPDAPLWAGTSLQFKYFGTTEAGAHFFSELEKCLTLCGVPTRMKLPQADAPQPEGSTRAAAEPAPVLLDFGPAEEPEQYRALDIAERMELAAGVAQTAPGRRAVDVFALCLLYGFRGSLYANPELLSRLRRVCRGLFARVPEGGTPPAPQKTVRTLMVLERIAWVAVPIAVCLLFALYCGSVLANAPFSSFL